VYDGRARRNQLVGEGAAAQALLDRCVVDLLVCTGELTRAHGLLSGVRKDNGMLKVARARFQAAAGDCETARRTAEAGARDPATTARDRVDLLVVEARCSLRLGRADEARDAFGLAHAIIERLGMIDAYAYVPPDDLAVLLDLLGVELAPDVVDALARVQAPAVCDGNLVLLTPRELEVLRQTAEHESVAAIAEALSVSVNTVKKQRVSLYSKLGVNDTHAAVLRAQRLGLL
jgi:LuxR family maltose regulon positive regulatory protein